MQTGRKWTVVLVVALMATAGALGVWLLRPATTTSDPAGSDHGPPRLTQAPAHLPVPEQPVDAALTPVSQIMEVWRRAILSRNADEVLTCDGIFREDPGRYLSALVASAKTDSENQVRAFSTRVLGKFQDPALVPVFRAMLADGDRYVRENAVWALGELRSRESAIELTRLARRDPADNVRAAAVAALSQIRGR